MGSVKDLEIITEPSRNKMGSGIFHFSDRYSVFDWGEMPDHLKNKGASLCVMSAYFFERLAASTRTHYAGVEMDGYYVSVDRLEKPSTKMKIRLVRVIKPTPRFDGTELVGYDYSAIRNERDNFVIPLEVIYRNTLPKGSSVFRRLTEGTLILEEIGLKEQPTEGAKLPTPFIDGSTKYEAFDRYPGWKELQNLSGLNDMEVEKLRIAVLNANEIISEGMRQAGLENEDGKLEFAFDPVRSLIVVDTLGTLDECRITYNGVEISKEIPRQYYHDFQPAWVAEIARAKKAKKRTGRSWCN